MPAPRCPPIHTSPAVWDKWTQDYNEYKKAKPYVTPFDKFKMLRRVRHLGDIEMDRSWKYMVYLTLTGRKHPTLTNYH